MGGNFDTDRECPNCGKDRLMSKREMEAIFQSNDLSVDEAAYMGLTPDSIICDFCKSAKTSGEWIRLRSVNERAAELADASSSKSRSDYQDILTD